jgi:flagellar hook-basal body complex protein FliE
MSPTGGAGGGLAAGIGGAKPDQGFGAMLKDAIGSVIESGRKSDGQTAAMVNGKADMVDVVTAVSQTEVAVEALVSVRDKVIQAYEEIMRMPI